MKTQLAFSPQGKPPHGLKGREPREGEEGAHHLRDLCNVFSVLPAGEHVGEGQGFQASVDEVRLGGRLLQVFPCSHTEGRCHRPGVALKALSFSDFP